MRTADHFECEAVTVPPEASVVEVADEMDAQGVGSVVVIDPKGLPIGIVTDRDLTRRVVAAGRDAGKTSAADVMTPEPVTGQPHETVEELLTRMTSHGVRRLPLVEGGKLRGLLSLDDLLLETATQLANVAETVRVELRETRRTTRRRRRAEAREDALAALRDELSQLAHQGEQARDRLRSELSDLLERIGR